MSLKYKRDETEGRSDYNKYKRDIAREKREMLIRKSKMMPLTEQEKAYLQALKDTNN